MSPFCLRSRTSCNTALLNLADFKNFPIHDLIVLAHAVLGDTKIR